MTTWTERPKELAYLLNPAFMASILLKALDGYGDYMPFAEIYLICPMVLHKGTRDKINSRIRVSLRSWAMRNNDLFADFPKRTESLVSYTNEAIEFLLGYKLIEITENGIHKTALCKTIDFSYILKLDKEISDCMNKSYLLGKWFFKMHTADNIYSALGVRP